jgi:hypothetical protein
LGYPYERGFGLIIAEANWKEGDRVGVGPFTNSYSFKVQHVNEAKNTN